MYRVLLCNGLAVRIYALPQCEWLFGHTRGNANSKWQVQQIYMQRQQRNNSVRHTSKRKTPCSHLRRSCLRLAASRLCSRSMRSVSSASRSASTSLTLRPEPIAWDCRGRHAVLSGLALYVFVSTLFFLYCRTCSCSKELKCTRYDTLPGVSGNVSNWKSQELALPGSRYGACSPHME